MKPTARDRVTTRDRAALDYITAHPGSTQREIRAHLLIEGKVYKRSAEQTTRECVARLKSSGLIEVTGKGGEKGTALLYSAKEIGS